MKTAGIRIDGAHLGATLVSLNGGCGLGTYRLGLVFDLLPMDWQRFHDARLFCAAEIGIGLPGTGSIPLTPTSLGVAAFASASQGTFPARLDLSGQFDQTQLDELERRRDGADLDLRLRFQGVLLSAQLSDQPPTIPTAFWTDAEFRIKKAEWVELLEQWDYAQGFHLQVPRFRRPSSPAAERATKELEAAIAKLADGDHRAAVAGCRDALELAYGDSDPPPPELGFKAPGLQSADKEARFWLLRYALRSLTNAAKHSDSTAAAIEWERRDAAALIRILASLLERDPPS
jgi:hypothetical protein